MESPAVARAPSRGETRFAIGLFLACLAFHFWGVQVGWQSRNLPGGEFRQAQTALSAYWIKQENNFSLAYPTPVVGKPWSVPMEFPFYQWTVVVTSKVTNWSLTKAGRAVSIACFYLALPAVFLLLRRWNVAPAHRWIVLALLLTCPLYIFYGRAFLIETMALMFSLWFWVAFERAVAERSKLWLAVAIVAGTGAGLVKVTTFLLYLLPAWVWAAMRLWSARRTAWKTDFLWMSAAVALPFAATLWWLRFADATKELNPLGVAFTSANLRSFNFGWEGTYFSADLWATKARIVAEQLTWLPALLFCLLAGVLVRRRWREMGGNLLAFGSVLVVFPILYAHHDYYYVANTVLLLVAMGLALVALAESALPRWAVWAAVLLVPAGQAWRYVQHYYPAQRAISPGGDGLTTSLRALTNPGDVIVVLGQDWNSMTPYYAQRRGVMIRNDIATDADRVERTLAMLDGEKIGALVIVGEPDGARWLIDRAAARGLGREPLYVWRDARIYVPEARRTELLYAILDNPFHEVALAPGVVVPPEDLSARWLDVAKLRRWQQRYFSGMTPQPVRVWASFGPGMDGSSGHAMYGAHPVTRLVFALPAGRHTLRSSLQLPLEAYRVDLADVDTTDGVEVSLFALGSDGARRQLATRLFNPRANRDDRGSMRPYEVGFTLEQAGEVELFFGPGPSGKDNRDWIQLGPLKIE
ncbi:hypothetical protein ESB00_07320 [Oleiharenicola lentus]|uniref:Glycosyltransferase RgtA/B/C/D-like domain-containing protein n=1 Tax=Oleiharenicola lentus TaxID=2508720 RepID=A0A4Q1C9M1_9BACT|nr:hypothetical protein [Oleiharenicola lentus]RXK55684.1 hypothetical protein ESB00_07320 [Oleiharenicola lentus]